MLFKDHLKIVTDAGAVLHLGWDYDIPYFLDPLNGIDVDLKTAQGVNQVGDTVEGQSVSGVSRTLDVVFWGAYALDNARAFSKKLPYFTKGTLYFGDHYFTRFVLQKTPYFSSYTPQPRCSLMLYSEKPFWYDLNAVSSVLGGYEKAFRFPVCYDSHIYGIKRDGTAAVLRNEGSLPVPFTATLRCDMPVTHPKVVDLQTGAFIGFDLTLQPDETLEIYRSTSDRLACTLTRAGVTTNIFSALDEDSTLTELQPGDNVLSMQAENGSGYLQALIPMQQTFSYISAHWMEGAIWLLGLGWGYLVKKVTEYKTIKDGLLAIMHDRLYQACIYYTQQGWIDASGLKNLEYLYQSYHALGGNGTGTELYNRAKALPIRD